MALIVCLVLSQPKKCSILRKRWKRDFDLRSQIHIQKADPTTEYADRAIRARKHEREKFEARSEDQVVHERRVRDEWDGHCDVQQREAVQEKEARLRGTVIESGHVSKTVTSLTNNKSVKEKIRAVSKPGKGSLGNRGEKIRISREEKGKRAGEYVRRRQPVKGQE